MHEIDFAHRLIEQINQLRVNTLREVMCQSGKLQYQLELLTCRARLLEKAMSHGWFLAAGICRNRLERAVDDLPWLTTNLQRYLDREEPSIPTMKDILAEFDQIQEELGPIRFDKMNKYLSITTEPITQDDQYLGEFEVRLDVFRLSEISSRIPYTVIALDPHPASSSDDVTHPHVSGRHLCEGDGSAAIRAALSHGRLFDFFSMVLGVLRTYNSDSPYVRLEDWNGVSCYDCGREMDREDRYPCVECGNDYCDYCSTYCAMCDDTICVGCAGRCEVCGQYLCKNCVQTCKECGRACCDNCMEDKLCNLCIKEHEDESTESNQSTTDESSETTSPEISPETCASVQPDGLGETIVLPGPQLQ